MNKIILGAAALSIGLSVNAIAAAVVSKNHSSQSKHVVAPLQNGGWYYITKAFYKPTTNAATPM